MADPGRNPGSAPSRRPRRTAFLLAATLAAAAEPAHRLAAQGAAGLPIGAGREDRVLITNFGEMTDVAAGPRQIYAVSSAGVVVYDPTFRRWELPLTAATGFPAEERATALAVDPLGGVLWLGTEHGSLYSLTPGMDRWDRVAMAGFAAILEIVPYPRESALYAVTGRGWLRLATGSFIPEPVAPADVPAAVRAAAAQREAAADPFLAAARGTIGVDPAMRRWRLAGVEPAERTGEYWVATFGGGLLRYDTRAMRAEWLPYGLLSRGAGAMAIDGDRIWFGGDGRGPRNGVTSADSQLQNWTLFESGYDGAPAGAVRDVLPDGDAVWFAADDGLYRFDTGTAGRDAWRRLGPAEGLSSNAALALAPGPGGLWVGTTRGLVLLTDSGPTTPRSLLPGVRINGLATMADTLWVASDEGLWFVHGAGAGMAPALPVELRGRVTDVAARGEDIFAVTENAWFRRTSGSWSTPQRGIALSRLGRLSGGVLGDEGFWLAGERGAGRMERATGQWTFFLAGDDLPAGNVRAIMPAGDHVWIATPAGALRLHWRR